MILRKTLPFLALLAAFVLLDYASADDKSEEGFVPLFNGKDLSGFQTVLRGDGKSIGTIRVQDGVINVSGRRDGYFHTDKSYKNYVLRFDWKFLKDGNSGCLVHITGDHQVWPKCFEVQGMQADHGAIYGLGGEGNFTTDKEAQKKAIKMGEWNTTEVISKDRELTSKVNGIQISTGKGDLTEGQIGWQSEGAPLQFKNIRIKVLK